MASSASALADVAEADALISGLFNSFDRDSNGALGVLEVAALFRQLSPEQSSQSARNAAVEALLMADADADKQLDRAEFGNLLAKVSNIAGLPLLEAARKLQQTTQQQPLASKQETTAASASSNTGPPAAAGESTAPGGAAAAATAPAAGSSEGAVLDNSKLRVLFELWDRTGDGKVNFGELCQGLAKFQTVNSKQDVLSLLRESACVLALHDANADRQLDFGEFSGFMATFMGAAGYQLQQVLDELLAIAASKPDSKKLQRVLDDAQPQIEQLLSGRQ